MFRADVGSWGNSNTEKGEAMSSRQRANPPWNAPRGMARMICVLTLFLACMVSGTAFAKKAEYQTRLSAGVRAKLVDNLYLDASVQQRSDLLFTDIQYRSHPI